VFLIAASRKRNYSGSLDFTASDKAGDELLADDENDLASSWHWLMMNLFAAFTANSLAISAASTITFSFVNYTYNQFSSRRYFLFQSISFPFQNNSFFRSKFSERKWPFSVQNPVSVNDYNTASE